MSQRADSEMATLLKRVKVYDDMGLTEYLAGVARRLCKGGACPPPSGDRGGGQVPTPRESDGAGGVKVTVIEDPTLAAFAMPGGRLFIHTGLLSAVENEAQLAAILAREMAHDPSKLREHRGRGATSRSALSPTAAAVLGLDLTLVAGAAIEGYGDDDEREADVEGMQWVAAAGYDASEAANVFQRLAGDAADRGGLAEIFFYGNRPRMGERADIVRALVGRSSPMRNPAGDSDGGARAFERRMRPVVRDNAALDVRAGRFALAQRQLDRVLASAPNDPVAQLDYGELHRLRSQHEVDPARTESAGRAIERYERALQLDPSSAEPLRQLALVYYQQRDTTRARAAFERYLALRPDAPDAQRIREYLAILADTRQ